MRARPLRRRWPVGGREGGRGLRWKERERQGTARRGEREKEEQEGKRRREGEGWESYTGQQHRLVKGGAEGGGEGREGKRRRRRRVDEGRVAADILFFLVLFCVNHPH